VCGYKSEETVYKTPRGRQKGKRISERGWVYNFSEVKLSFDEEGSKRE